MQERRESPMDRRSGEDRRKAHDPDYFLKGGVERRRTKERRSGLERRSEWIQVSKWSSISLWVITRGRTGWKY